MGFLPYLHEQNDRFCCHVFEKFEVLLDSIEVPVVVVIMGTEAYTRY